MKTGIVGLGVVGTANRVGFEQLGHTVKIHDIKFNTNIEDIIDTEIICICVPTPSASNGSCNTSIVKSVIVDLDKLNYQGVIALSKVLENVARLVCASIIEVINLLF